MSLTINQRITFSEENVIELEGVVRTMQNSNKN